MFCVNCGSQIPDGQYFCNSCGAQVQEPMLAQNGVQTQWAQMPYKQAQYSSAGLQPAKKQGRRWLFLAVGVFAAAVITVLALWLLGVFQVRNLGTITVAYEFGDYELGQTVSKREILSMIEDEGFRYSTGRLDETDCDYIVLQNAYGSDSPLDITDIRLKRNKNGKWIFIGGTVGQNREAVEGIVVGADFEDVLRKYPDIVGDVSLENRNCATQWHLYVSENGEILDGYDFWGEWVKDPKGFEGRLITIYLDSDGDVRFVRLVDHGLYWGGGN